MKKLKMILILMLMMNLSAVAMTAKVKDEDKTIYRLLEGETQNQMGKPGLAVDLSYKSEHVEVGEVSDVNITLISQLKQGTLKVKVAPLNESLVGLEEQNFEFKLSESKRSFPINLQVGSSQSGIYYINLIVSLEGEGSRVLAVPVHIGETASKIENKQLERTDNGIAISVSSAQEEIK